MRQLSRFDAQFRLKSQSQIEAKGRKANKESSLRRQPTQQNYSNDIQEIQHEQLIRDLQNVQIAVSKIKKKAEIYQLRYLQKKQYPSSQKNISLELDNRFQAVDRRIQSLKYIFDMSKERQQQLEQKWISRFQRIEERFFRFEQKWQRQNIVLSQQVPSKNMNSRSANKTNHNDRHIQIIKLEQLDQTKPIGFSYSKNKGEGEERKKKVFDDSH